MSGSSSFLRSGGLKAREILYRCRSPLANAGGGGGGGGGGGDFTALWQRRVFVSSIPAAAKFGRESCSHIPPAATAFISSPASAAARNGFVGWYLGMIEARPILTKSITASAIFTAADLSAQIIGSSNLSSIDWIRTLRMASYGMLFSGPSLHLWFNLTSRLIPKRDVVSTFKKVFMGQAIFGPIMTTVFFSLNAALQGETTDEIFARLKRDVIPTLINGLFYWPMCDFVTFRFVPVRLQPLVSNSFAFLWTIYITYVASLQKAPVPQIAAN